jgi:type I restriction enzyme S subunit
MEIATKYKDTKIGTVPDEWGIFAVNDLCKVGRGASPRPVGDPKYFGGLTPWIKIADANRTGTRYIEETRETVTEEGKNRSVFLKKGSLIVSNSGSAGIPKFLAVDGCIHDGWLYFTEYKNLDDKFFYYWWLYNGQRVSDTYANGAVLQNLNTDLVRNLFIATPKIEEQKKISSILWNIDDKIELNRKINNNLETLVGVIFKQWFIDVKDNLPLGWKIGKVSDVVKVESGFPFNSRMFDDLGKYKLVTIKNVQDGYFVTECTDSLSELPQKMPTHCKLKDGDILLSLTGNVGRVCLVNGSNYLLNQRVANLIPIIENNRAFTYFLFRQKDFQNTLMSISRGTAQQNLSPIETKSLEIVVPSQEALDRFSKIASPILKMLIENHNEIRNLLILRDSLLPRLLNGKIVVK